MAKAKWLFHDHFHFPGFPVSFGTMAYIIRPGPADPTPPNTHIIWHYGAYLIPQTECTPPPHPTYPPVPCNTIKPRGSSRLDGNTNIMPWRRLTSVSCSHQYWMSHSPHKTCQQFILTQPDGFPQMSGDSGRTPGHTICCTPSSD